MSTRINGIVKKFFPEKGYGFIGVKGADDVFVHQTALKEARIETLQKGDQVSFIVGSGDRGKSQAVKIILDKAASADHSAPRSSASPIDTTTSFVFDEKYLKDGYFVGDTDHLRAEELDGWAENIAKLLGNKGMNSHQMRRLFNKARGIEQQMKQRPDFELTKEEIISLRPDVFYQKGRKLVPDEFKQFIERNVDCAKRDKRNFMRGFIPHFESVLAYFVYYFKDRE